MPLSAQVITDKDGYSIDVTNFETIEVYMSTNALKRVKVVGDGYDEVFLNNGLRYKIAKESLRIKFQISSSGRRSGTHF